MTASQLQRILYVEDEPDIREVAKLALEVVGGFTVELCASGEEALASLSRFAPDLILLDVMMPGMDGPTTLQALRSVPRAQHIPAIFMTAKIQPQEILQLKHIGALDVIPKPFDPMTLAQTVRDIWSGKDPSESRLSVPPPAIAPAEAKEAIANITQHFVESIPERIAEIAALIQTLHAGTVPDESRQTLYRKVHSLNGSAKTFGLVPISEAARALERRLKPIAASLDALSAQEAAQVDTLFDTLVRCVAERGISVHLPAAPAVIPSEPVAEPGKLIYLFADRASWTEPLQLQLEGCGYAVRVFADSAQLLSGCIDHRPTAVITDVSLAVGDWQGAQMAARLRDTLRTPPPAIFVCDRDDLDARLQAARAGGVAYFTRPLKFTALMDKLDELSVHASPEPYRVMIVEDAEEQAVLCSTVLRQAGMLTCVVSDPPQLLAQLAEFHPDLVLMDMYLPGCTGDELAKIVRQMEPFVGVPIVFLSVESDFNRQLTAMGLGGDEFLTKPILPAQLVSVVGSRIRHYRRLRALMVQDGLTGLANHSRLQQVLETEVARALRQATPLTLVMIDIDDFKLINDRYGHPAGDRVLLALSRFVRQRLRLSDVVARYGGEEFAIVMANTEGADAHTVVERLRSHFATLVHEGDQGETFSVTFSAGIAAIAGHGSARALLLAADRSLYSAKERGRNCVVLDRATRP